MGTVQNVNFSKFPKQGSFLNRRVRVCFEYDTSKTIEGVVVREDEEEPGVMIISLDDGRYILSTECQYRLLYSIISNPALRCSCNLSIRIKSIKQCVELVTNSEGLDGENIKQKDSRTVDLRMRNTKNLIV